MIFHKKNNIEDIVFYVPPKLPAQMLKDVYRYQIEIKTVFEETQTAAS